MSLYLATPNRRDVFTHVCQFTVGLCPSMHLGAGCVSQHALAQGCVNSKGLWAGRGGEGGRGWGVDRGSTLLPEIATDTVGSHPTGMHSLVLNRSSHTNLLPTGN